MKFHGVLYVQSVLIAFLILLLYQNTVLYADPMFLLLPFVLGMMLVFMLIVEETEEANVIFGALFLSVTTLSLAYSYAMDFFFYYIGISIFIVLGVVDVSGMILLADVALKERRRKQSRI